MNAEIIEFLSVGTKVSPGASSLGTLSWLFLSRGMVKLHSLLKMGKGFPDMLIAMCVEGKLSIPPGREREEEVGLSNHPLPG